jgi:signal transduction histidine kinase
MVAYTELLRQGTPEEQFEAAQQALPGLENAARRVQRLVNDLVDLARISAGRFEVQPAAVDLAAIIRQIAEQLQETTDQHRLIVDVPQTVPGEWDPARIRQVLTSLITNAIQYSPDGGEIRIAARLGEREVEISVADQGIGIAPEQMSRLFLPFSRLDPEPTTKDTGLGLYFAKAIVEAHGGRIWLQSRPGKGTTFFFALPLRPERLT